MFDRILVPLDGSKLAERAIPHVRHFARVFNAQVIILQVLDSSPYMDDPRAVEPLNWQIRKAQADLYMQTVAAQLRESGLHAEYALREGRAAETIIDFAHSENIDLLVMTTHGASGLSRWNASAIAQKVLDKVFLPLLLVRSYPPASALQSGEADAVARKFYGVNAAAIQGTRTVNAHEGKTSGPATAGEPIPPGATAAGASAAAAATGSASQASTTEVSENRWQRQGISPSISEEEAVYRRILLPIDTSRRAECAITAANALAQQGVKLILAAVVRPPDLPIPAPYPAELNELTQRFMEASRQAVAGYLEEQRNRLSGQVETRSVEGSNISTELHNLAEQEDVDLVVLCAHGQTGGSQWPYGSVARNYIEHGDRCVLLVQDVPRVQIRPTAAEMAAEKYGRR